MSKTFFLASFIAAAVSAATPNTAHAESAARICPGGYVSILDLCIHLDAGDVVQASGLNENVGGNCPSGYWRTGALCIELATGDVISIRGPQTATSN